MTEQTQYPAISGKLINCLEKDYIDQLPTRLISEFELGRLIGRQDIIKRLKLEKEFSEEKFNA